MISHFLNWHCFLWSAWSTCLNVGDSLSHGRFVHKWILSEIHCHLWIMELYLKVFKRIVIVVTTCKWCTVPELGLSGLMEAQDKGRSQKLLLLTFMSGWCICQILSAPFGCTVCIFNPHIQFFITGELKLVYISPLCEVRCFMWKSFNQRSSFVYFPYSVVLWFHNRRM